MVLCQVGRKSSRFSLKGCYCVRYIKVNLWLNGPDELKLPVVNRSFVPAIEFAVSDDDVEMKKVIHTSVIKSELPDIVTFFENRVSSWTKMCRVMCFILKFIENCKKRQLDQVRSEVSTEVNFSFNEIESAKTHILRLVQEKYFQKDLIMLKKAPLSVNDVLQFNSKLLKLDPFISAENLLQVGGRIQLCTDSSIVHPTILPKESLISKRIISHYHAKVKHSGRTTTVNAIRNAGFWIVNVNHLTSRLIFSCVVCHILRGSLSVQKMSNLPEDRVSCEGPFIYVGVDLFGPYVTKVGRKEYKRYGLIFTCLTSRSSHLEMCEEMSTDSFICALRRFISRRRFVKLLRSDNGSNFIGADKELRLMYESLDHNKIREFLKSENCKYIEWKFNAPYAKHTGGVWERIIRSIKSILKTCISQASGRINDEGLRTFFCEAEAILNSSPLAVENLNDPTSDVLTCNHLLTMKSQIVLPPGVFNKNDVYSRKRWKTIQYMIQLFWNRWRKEFLAIKQVRNKWNVPTRNFQKGDVVLVKDEELFRNQWPIARILSTNTGEDELVRTITLRFAKSTTPFERSVHKLVLLVENEGCV